MSHAVMLIPIDKDTSVDKEIISSLLKVLEKNEINACSLNFLDLIGENKVEDYLMNSQLDELLDDIVAVYENVAKDKDIIIIEGLNFANKYYAVYLNREIAVALTSYVVLVGTEKEDMSAELETNYFRLVAQSYKKCKFLSNIIYKNNADIEKKMANYISENSLNTIMFSSEEKAVTAPYFRYRLIQRAKQQQKTIVLPEGNEIRTIKAANICAKNAIAKCILLASPDSVAKHGIVLDANIEIIDPQTIRDKYINPLFELRKHKGMTYEKASVQLEDNIVLGTMMVQSGDAHGLVSGAVNTTANTIRPALQLVKPKPDASLVSSCFFMGFPEEVLLFADCAFNVNPDAEELADIAIQTADTAKNFGISPQVAMMSYSTGSSGFGDDVDKVCNAVSIVREKRPDIMVEGPIQYDAALVADVAKLKLPNSRVAGRATVFVFPDLNSGNCVAKAAQRAADIVVIGPISQGLNKPINDLSRGCSVRDIVFTIAATCSTGI